MEGTPLHPGPGVETVLHRTYAMTSMRLLTLETENMAYLVEQV